MPKTAKTELKQIGIQFEVEPSGDPFDLSNPVPATVPLPNDVIITTVIGPYTEKDRKLWAFLVASVWDELQSKQIHEMRVSKINKIFEELGGDTSTSWIWESAKRLAKTQVEWEEGPIDDRLVGIASMLSSALTHKNARSTGFLRFALDPMLCEVIKKPFRFSRLRLHFMIGLSGKYAVTLYMLLESVANLQNPALEVELDKLRSWLKIPDEKFERWVDVRRFVLEPAIKQINAKPELSGFSVAMEAIKEGRAVDRVRFTLTKSAERLEEEKRLQPALKSDQLNEKEDKGGAAMIHLPPSAFEAAKKSASGWDVYALESEWREWLADKPIPENPAGSFVAFCKKRGKV